MAEHWAFDMYSRLFLVGRKGYLGERWRHLSSTWNKKGEIGLNKAAIKEKEGLFREDELTAEKEGHSWGPLYAYLHFKERGLKFGTCDIHLVAILSISIIRVGIKIQ